jgi:hypothetical protein
MASVPSSDAGAAYRFNRYDERCMGIRRADERTRTAFPCSLRVIHQALQGGCTALQIPHI